MPRLFSDAAFELQISTKIILISHLGILIISRGFLVKGKLLLRQAFGLHETRMGSSFGPGSAQTQRFRRHWQESSNSSTHPCIHPPYTHPCVHASIHPSIRPPTFTCASTHLLAIPKVLIFGTINASVECRLLKYHQHSLLTRQS